MLVSWDWLQEYVKLDSVDAATARWTMAGLNLESISPVGSDTAIDLEVTSNRPDCLGHIGVAREAAVLFGRTLTIPDPKPPTSSAKTAGATKVTIECEDLCPRYIARVIRGVRVGPSPAWLRNRLASVGIASINNVVDITNYVLMECGQPLHAFDFDKLREQRIVVRRARKGEKIIAIDQRSYELDPEMCVIADAQRTVAIGGVMGGLETEIGSGTVNVLIETAEFTPTSIRSTARKLGLHSDSSYRFERGVDSQQLDWASRRCCQLILEWAGGELLDGSVLAGQPAVNRSVPIRLRFAQIPRILGIDVPQAESVRILTDLGLKQTQPVSNGAAEFAAPSWRGDLRREIDLIEEIARIHGYEKIPDDVDVPLGLSSRTQRDRVTERVRDVLAGAGFYEAVTMSFVSEDERQLFTPSVSRPLSVDHSSRRHENLLRQSLIPSLLKSRRENERHGTFNAELFEIAKVYWKAAPHELEREVEPTMIGLVTGRSFLDTKGVVEALLRRINASAVLSVRPSELPQFIPGRGAELVVNGEFWGWFGELDRAVTDRLDLRDAVTVAEVHLHVLESVADLIPISRPLAQFPPVPRDLNFVLDEAVSWQALEAVVREAGGPLLEDVSFGGQFRGQQLGAGKKSYLVTVSYRSSERTLTGAEVERDQRSIIEACRQKLGATLRA